MKSEFFDMARIEGTMRCCHYSESFEFDGESVAYYN